MELQERRLRQIANVIRGERSRLPVEADAQGQLHRKRGSLVVDRSWQWDEAEAARTAYPPEKRQALDAFRKLPL